MFSETGILRSAVRSVIVCGLTGLFLFPLEAVSFKVLIFSRTADFRHEPFIDAQIPYIKALGTTYGFDADASEDTALWTDAYLNQYKAIILLHTTGQFLGTNQQKALERYMQSGHGIAAIHAAADAYKDNQWPWYTRMFGTKFLTHPYGSINDIGGNLTILTHDNPSTVMLPDLWPGCPDEWFYFPNNPADSGCTILATLDESTIDPCGVPPMGYHPVMWKHDYDGGRFWYTARGHFADIPAEKLFGLSLVGGIFYAAGVPLGSLNVPFPEAPPIARASSAKLEGGYDRKALVAQGAADDYAGTNWIPLQFLSPEWISFDYRETRKFTGAEISWQDPGVPDYTVQSSNDTLTWTDIYTAGGNGKIGFTATARYLRVRVTSGVFAVGNWYPAALTQFTVLFAANSRPTAVDPPIKTYLQKGIRTGAGVYCDLQGRMVRISESRMQRKAGMTTVRESATGSVRIIRQVK